MELTWLGRSCFQLMTRHRTRVIFDPYLEQYRERGLPPLPLPDLICVSHGHLDHFADVPDLVRGDSPAQVVAIPELCRALRELLPETRYRLFPIAWGDQVELNGLRFFAYQSPAMRTSLHDMFEEFGVRQVLEFLRACRQLADEFLYLPLTSFGVDVDGRRVLHFVAEGVGPGEPVDVAAIGARFAPDVALVGVHPGQEVRAAGYAAALGAPLAIPHHHHAYGKLPAADLDLFVHELHRLAMDVARNEPHLPFFRPLLDFVAQMEDAAAAREQLSDFLASDRICARTDDDKSLVLADALQSPHRLPTDRLIRRKLDAHDGRIRLETQTHPSRPGYR